MAKTAKEIIKDNLGHSEDCDCLYCRKDGTFDRIVKDIIALLPKKKGIPDDPNHETYEYWDNLGYNQAVQDCREAIERRSV